MAVRREKVVLELEDHFTTGMMRAAAATALLDKELGSLSKESVRARGAARSMDADITKLGKSAERSGSEIDRLSGRMRIFADVAAVLGPSLVPIGAAAIPVVAGLATQMTVAGVAAGTAVLAFHGVGDALDALNAYQLDPTKESLAKLNAEFAKVGPSGEHFVKFLDKIGPQLGQLSTTARGGLFPGLESGITRLTTLLPQVDFIVGSIADAMGTLATEAGAGLSGPAFQDFFTFLEVDAKPILLDLGRTIGNFAEGLSHMLVQFGPLSQGFSSGLLEMSRSFAAWSRGLDDNQSFQSFLDYIRENTPAVLDFLAALATAVGSIVAAAAPVGSVVLPALTSLVEVMGSIAASPLGPALVTMAAAWSAYSRAASIANISNQGVFKSMGVGIDGVTKRMALLRRGSGAAGLVGLGLTQMVDTSDAAGKSLHTLGDAASGALLGFSIGGPIGGAIGAGAGALLGLATATDHANDSMSTGRDRAANYAATLDEITGKATNATRALVLQKLQEAKALPTARRLGIAPQDLIGATLGNQSAANRIKAQMDALWHKGLELQKQGSDEADQVFRDYGRITNVLRDQGIEFKSQQDQLRQNNHDLATWGQLLKGLPPKVQTEVKALGVDASNADVAALAEKYKLTPKQVTTVLKAIGRPQASLEVEVLRHGLKSIPRSVFSKLTADGKQALREAESVRRSLAAIQDKRVDIWVTQHAPNQAERNKITNRAAGGIIRGPGGPREDLIPALLSDGEFVVNAFATDRYRRELEAMNAQRYASGGIVAQRRELEESHAVRYASGGPVRGGSSTSGSGSSLVGLTIVGTLDTPYGPSRIRGVVRDELANRDDMVGMRKRAGA